MSALFATIDVLGVPVASLAPEDALAHAERLFEADEASFIAHVNAHTLNLASHDPDYRDVLRRAGMVLNDGKGMMLAARLLGERFPADLNGNYFGPRLLERASEHGWKVFFLGAGPGVAQAAADMLTARIPRLRVVGTNDGYFASDAAAIEAIDGAGAELVFVGMGNPLQERWMDRCLSDTHARLAVGVGAFFDFITGTVPRAPRWMNRVGLEWLHRLVQEPRRMWRRYLVGNPIFLARIVKARLARRRGVPS